MNDKGLQLPNSLSATQGLWDSVPTDGDVVKGDITPGASGADSVAAAATSSTPTTAQRQGVAGVEPSVASENGRYNPNITAQRPFNIADFMQGATASSRMVEPAFADGMTDEQLGARFR